VLSDVLPRTERQRRIRRRLAGQEQDLPDERAPVVAVHFEGAGVLFCERQATAKAVIVDVVLEHAAKLQEVERQHLRQRIEHDATIIQIHVVVVHDSLRTKPRRQPRSQHHLVHRAAGPLAGIPFAAGDLQQHDRRGKRRRHGPATLTDIEQGDFVDLGPVRDGRLSGDEFDPAAHIQSADQDAGRDQGAAREHAGHAPSRS
jgi:hypothetical protein